MDGFFTFVVLIAIATPVLSIAGFAMALGLRRRVTRLESMLAEVPPRFEAAAAAAATPPAEPIADPIPADGPAIEPVTPPEAEASEPEPIAARVRPVSLPRVDIEERLGTRWAVWIGGIALALGGLLLVRYSFEQGWFGPAARISAGAVLALALIAAGDWLRRRELGQHIVGIASAHVPSVLTAAGTATAFGTVYAAHALYDFIGPAAAFVLLGAVGLATMAAAALHGPALAAFGLVAALASPLLVETENPDPWPLLLYLALTVLAAYGLARLRLWRWLAIAAAVGAFLWGWVFVISGDQAPATAYVLIQLILAAIFIAIAPHIGEPDASARFDLFAFLVLAGFAVLGIIVADLYDEGSARAFIAAIMVAIYLAVGLYVPPAGSTLIAAAVATATLAFWPVAQLVADEPRTVLPGPGGTPQPEALTLYLAFAVLSGLAIAAASLWRIANRRDLPLKPATIYSATATLGPLAMLVVTYWRVTAFDTSVPFGIAAAAVAALGVAATRWLQNEERGSSAIGLAVGSVASASLSAIALGLTFTLEKGMLTVAVALAALGTAWIAERSRIPMLRYAVGAAGLVLLGRILWDPTIAGSDLGQTPVFNWLLFGYGVPAVSFALAGRILARKGRDRITRLCESLAILFAALLVLFEIRHTLNDGNPFAPGASFLEAGLFATTGLLFSLVMVRLDDAEPDPVYRGATFIFGIFTIVAAATGLLVENPYFTGQPVTGGRLINTLIPAYLVPAFAAAALAAVARTRRPFSYVGAAVALALLLHLAYTALAIRRFFHGAEIAHWLPTSSAELWSYSVALLLIGVAVLAVGILKDWRFARLLSAPYFVLATLKVFLIDLAHLEGVLRALSFIGLGLILIGIGLAYQRLVFRQAPPAVSEPGGG
jgi:uncharacterized membrane protein